MTWPRVSVIIPCRNEGAHLDRCLASVRDAAYPADRLEVLVVDGASDDDTLAIARSHARADPRVRVLPNPRRIVPTALNQGIRAASGAIIVRMDAHAEYPRDYVPRLVRALETTGADNVGGRLSTRPGGDGAVARAIALALSSRFGVGNAHFRVGTATAREVDTVPFGCFRREVFDRVGLFDEDLVRNQDDEFNHRLIRRGGRIVLVPDIVSVYYGRRTLSQLARMYWQYGCYKALAIRRAGGGLTVRACVPAAFVLALVALSGLGSLYRPAWAALAGLIGVYGLAAGVAAWRACRRGSGRCVAALIAAFAAMHVAYGAGCWRGLAYLRRRPAPGGAAAIPLSR